jgi:NADPH:quinone reductase-like Zn-dependent oxidoreductase
MKAILHERYGSPDQLRLADSDTPTVADDGVLVRVRASSVNAGDWRKVRANPFIIRMGGGWRRPKVQGLGVDAAGEVVEVGPLVTGLGIGDEVYGIRTGAFAEYVSGVNFVRKPANLSFEQAAAVPVAAITALQAVRDHGGIQAGHRALVIGAGGGVGSFTVQLAKVFGARVTAMTSPAHLDMVRGIGADEVLDYTQAAPGDGGERYDLVVDVGGAHRLPTLLRVLAPGGKVVLVGAGKGASGPLVRILSAIVRSRLLRQPVDFFIGEASITDLRTLAELIEAGKVTPVIDRTYSLAEIPQALRYAESERARGKIVITI